jgi:hypothetical protein
MDLRVQHAATQTTARPYLRPSTTMPMGMLDSVCVSLRTAFRVDPTIRAVFRRSSRPRNIRNREISLHVHPSLTFTFLSLKIRSQNSHLIVLVKISTGFSSPDLRPADEKKLPPITLSFGSAQRGLDTCCAVHFRKWGTPNLSGFNLAIETSNPCFFGCVSVYGQMAEYVQRANAAPTDGRNPIKAHHNACNHARRLDKRRIHNHVVPSISDEIIGKLGSDLVMAQADKDTAAMRPVVSS